MTVSFLCLSISGFNPFGIFDQTESVMIQSGIPVISGPVPSREFDRAAKPSKPAEIRDMDAPICPNEQNIQPVHSEPGQLALALQFPVAHSPPEQTT